MIEPDTRIRVFTRYLREYRGRKRSVAITMTLQPACIPLMDVGVCVRVKATHAEDDPVGREPGCGTLRQYASPSWFIDLVAYPSPSSSSAVPSSIVVRSPSLPPVQSSFFSALPSLHVRSTSRARAPLFRFCSARAFYSRISSRARGLSIVNIFCCTIFIKFLSVNWESYAHLVSKYENSIRERKRTYEFVQNCLW